MAQYMMLLTVPSLVGPVMYHIMHLSMLCPTITHTGRVGALQGLVLTERCCPYGRDFDCLEEVANRAMFPVYYIITLSLIISHALSFTNIMGLLAHVNIIPYTRVNKHMCLFPKLQGNMRLIPNMLLIMKDQN